MFVDFFIDRKKRLCRVNYFGKYLMTDSPNGHVFPSKILIICIEPCTEIMDHESHEENVKHVIDVKLSQRLVTISVMIFIHYYEFYHRSFVFIRMKEYLIMMISDRFRIDSFPFKQGI